MFAEQATFKEHFETCTDSCWLVSHSDSGSNSVSVPRCDAADFGSSSVVPASSVQLLPRSWQRDILEHKNLKVNNRRRETFMITIKRCTGSTINYNHLLVNAPCCPIRLQPWGPLHFFGSSLWCLAGCGGSACNGPRRKKVFGRALLLLIRNKHPNKQTVYCRVTSTDWVAI